jgi:A/G-specific adenine glycosylase
MLQQTRIGAVLGYYDRFLAAFPTIAALADAREEELLKQWEGLGYYSRARNLHKAAQMVMAEGEGKLPDSYVKLKSLPGIGEYTAGAIASICYGESVPVVDGNVLRVLARLLAFRGYAEEPKNKKDLRALAAELIPAEHPGDFNQAIMELGEVVCLPNAVPACGACPITAFCAAYRQGCAADLPIRMPKKQRRRENRAVILVISREMVLLFRREQGLLRGMYEPINLLQENGHANPKNTLQSILPLQGKITSIGAAKHLFTHVEWHMRGYVAYVDSPLPVEGGVWATWEDVREKYAIPAAFRAFTTQLPGLLAGGENTA